MALDDIYRSIAWNALTVRFNTRLKTNLEGGWERTPARFDRFLVAGGVTPISRWSAEL